MDEVEEGSAQEQDGEHAGRRRRRRGGGRCRGAVLSCEQARKQVFGAWMVAIAVEAAVAVRENGWRVCIRLTEDEKAVLWPVEDATGQRVEERGPGGVGVSCMARGVELVRWHSGRPDPEQTICEGRVGGQTRRRGRRCGTRGK